MTPLLPLAIKLHSRDPEFLQLFLILVALNGVVFALERLRLRYLRQRVTATPKLSEGDQRVAFALLGNATTTQLIISGVLELEGLDAIEIRREGQEHRVSRSGLASAADISGVPLEIYKVLLAKPASIRELLENPLLKRIIEKEHIPRVRKQLEEDGFFTIAQKRKRYPLSHMYMLFLMFLGSGKCILHDPDKLFTPTRIDPLILIMGALLAAFLFVWRDNEDPLMVPSLDGEGWTKRLESQHRQTRSRFLRAPGPERYNAPILVMLFGTQVLSGTPFAYLHDASNDVLLVSPMA